MKILGSNGNVGVGIASPTTKLDVGGSINNGTHAAATGYMANRSLTIGNTASNFGGGTGQWNTNTAGFMMECLDNTEIAVHDAGTRVASFMYFEGGTNRFTIGRNMGWGGISALVLNGNVGIGVASPAYKLHVADGDNSVTYYGPNTTWGGLLFVGAGSNKTVTNNTVIAQCIVTDGNLHLDAGHARDIYMNHYSGSYIRHGGSGLYSDDRLKSEEELITNATDTLLKLSPQKYLKKRTLRENETREPVIESGLIAQDIWYDAPELRHIVLLGADADPTENKPEAPVDGDIQQDPDYSSWGPNAASVNYDGLIAYLVKSNQEIYTELQAEKTKTNTLDTELQAEKSKTTALETKLQEAEAKTTTLETKLQTETAALETELQAEKTKTSTFETKLQEAEAKIATLQAEKEAIRSDLSSLVLRVAALES
jgi:Skp family chaperone for outer membrane proteins